VDPFKNPAVITARTRLINASQKCMEISRSYDKQGKLKLTYFTDAYADAAAERELAADALRRAWQKALDQKPYN
jgi:hypothetical protein